MRIDVLLIGLALANLPSASYAQTVRADIPFAFLAAGKEMPPGSYQIEKSPAGPVVLSGPRLAATTVLPVLTYLGRHDTDAEIELIFDKIDGRLHLSEVWLPRQDGVLLLGTSERHDHAVLKAPKK